MKKSLFRGKDYKEIYLELIHSLIIASIHWLRTGFQFHIPAKFQFFIPFLFSKSWNFSPSMPSEPPQLLGLYFQHSLHSIIHLAQIQISHALHHMIYALLIIYGFYFWNVLYSKYLFKLIYFKKIWKIYESFLLKKSLILASEIWVQSLFINFTTSNDGMLMQCSPNLTI